MLLEAGDKAGIVNPSNPSQTGAVWVHTGYHRLSSRQEQSLGTEEQIRGTSTKAGWLKPPKKTSLGSAGVGGAAWGTTVLLGPQSLPASSQTTTPPDFGFSQIPARGPSAALLHPAQTGPNSRAEGTTNLQLQRSKSNPHFFTQLQFFFFFSGGCFFVCVFFFCVATFTLRLSGLAWERCKLILKLILTLFFDWSHWELQQEGQMVPFLAVFALWHPADSSSQH